MSPQISNPFTTAAEWMLNKAFHSNHQRPLRVNRHRKHFASWYQGYKYDPTTGAFTAYLKCNGHVVAQNTSYLSVNAVDFPEDVELRPIMAR